MNSEEKPIRINILGTEYLVIQTTSNECEKLEETFGFFEPFSKKVVIDKKAEFQKEKLTCENLGEFKKKLLRHEIIHAFFYESGLDEYSSNEELVEWLAIQFPKIQKVFEKLELGD